MASKTDKAAATERETLWPAKTDPQLLEYMELLFFAYRDFTSDPDAMLSEIGFGRAHHRVLHFVNRHAEMRVADLLDILKITKQSLAPVLKQLIDGGFIAQKTGDTDRRERRLSTTKEGAILAARLAEPQMSRLTCALADTGATEKDAIRHFLISVIDAGDRDRVAQLMTKNNVG